VRITVLGCSGSVVGPDSPASGYLLRAPDTSPLVIDFGGGVLGALQRHADPGSVHVLLSHLHADHCIDLPSLFVGAEGTLGVITALDLRLHPDPPHRVTAVCGFEDLDALVDAGRLFRDLDGIAALELIDGRASALTDEHLGVAAPVRGDWLLLVELASDHDQTERLADALEEVRTCGEPAVGVDSTAQQRLWRLRESIAEVLGVYGPPVKFDVSLPLPAVAAFARDADALLHRHAPDAIGVLFGHIGEGNLHLNVLRCSEEQERDLYAAMMDLIAGCGGNVSSEHGVGSRKRKYVSMSREPADIAAMRTLKTAFDPTGYLNAAVLFD